MNRRISNRRALCGALLTGFLLFSLFPPLEWDLFAWLALLPLLMLCFAVPPRRAFRFGFVGGAVFWLASLVWLCHVTVLGWFLLALYCGLYVGVFAMAVAWWAGRGGFRRGVGRWLGWVGVPAVWVALELARNTLFTGFGWNPLGVSQYRNLALIQCAEWGGVYLVSYGIVLVNTAFALAIQQARARAPDTPIPVPWPALFSLLLVLAAGWTGKDMLSHARSFETPVTITAIQPNIPQVEKWSEDFADSVYRRIEAVTASVFTQSAPGEGAPPSLIVWPETALPDFVRADLRGQDLIQRLLTNGAPLLVGTLDFIEQTGHTNFFNGSFLFTPGIGLDQLYHKCHLVPFGEYVPLGDFLPFIRAFTPIPDSLSAGVTNAVFSLPPSGVRFSALICFEDVFPDLARRCVRNGARLLVNQSNDAWYDPSCAGRQHMTHSVLRAVENRVPVVRSTNTGLTCFIDRNGRIHGALRPRQPGFSTQSVAAPAPGMTLTFYTRQGDVFAVGCAALALFLFAFARLFWQKEEPRGQALSL